MKSVCKYAIISPVSIQIFGNAVLFSDFRFCEGILTNDEKGKEPHSQAFLGGNVMRKVVSVLLSAAMALSLCAGCSSSSSDTADTKAAEEKGADAADTEAGEAAEGVMPAVAKEDLKVGVIHIGNPADGSGYSYTHDQGIVAMQKAVGLEDDQIIRKNNVADDDQTAIETAMRECVEEGCQIIFATSWGYMDACEALAEEYPDVIFSHATGYKSNGVNFNNYFGRIYQILYSFGIISAPVPNGGGQNCLRSILAHIRVVTNTKYASFLSCQLRVRCIAVLSNDITALVDQGYGCLFLTFRIVPAVGGLDVNGCIRVYRIYTHCKCVTSAGNLGIVLAPGADITDLIALCL